MKNDSTFFAVDLGATSGRTILGRLKENNISWDEVTRFPNHLIEQGGHFYWDIYALYREIIQGLKEVARRGEKITSIGIDTWGVDFVCIAPDGAILRNPRSYRDPVTFDAMDDYVKHVVSKKELYDITGIQLMNFNSIFQLYAMRREQNTALDNASKILFVPDALSWMLTGNEVCEYTIASTSELLDPRTGQLDERLLQSVGLSRSKFGKMVKPGTLVGTLTEEVQRMTGLGPVPVYAVAGHDTGSAVAAVPAQDEQFAYLSSGTWSLMGIETRQAIINDTSYERNFTNEGGIEGTTRFLKNICGMWIYERCRSEWSNANNGQQEIDISHGALQDAAMKETPFRSLINPDNECFANPPSMVEAIQNYCRNTQQPVPETPAQICRCIFESLALRYKQVFSYLKEMAPFPIKVLHVIGGGMKNNYMNQFTANATGVTVLTGPQEATAFGNIMVQAKAVGLVGDIWEMRRIIRASLLLGVFEPQEQEAWNKAYEKYLKNCN